MQEAVWQVRFVPLSCRSCLLTGKSMIARDAGGLIYILMQRADKSFSISSTL